MELIISGKKFLIDDEDYYLFEYCKWNCNNKQGYLRNQWKINNLYHRVIMKDEIEKFSKIHNIKENRVAVDHINRDVTDNRKQNLRCVTYTDNMMNRPIQKNNTSGHKGIMITKYGKFRVNFTYNKIKYRPSFDKLEDALQYREDKIKELKIFEYKNN